MKNRTLKTKMGLEVAEKAINLVVNYKYQNGPFSVVVHAGEPMSVGLPYMIELQSLIDNYQSKKTPINFNIQTNATLINEQWCHFIKENNIDVGVSIDGPKHVHDKNRKSRNGQGTFDKVLSGIQLLKEFGIPIRVIAVLTSYSLDRPREIFDFFENLGIDSIGFNNDELDGSNTYSSVYSSTFEKYQEFITEFTNLWISNGRPFKFRQVDSFLSSLNIIGDKKLVESIGNQTADPLKIVTVSCEGKISTFSPELISLDENQDERFFYGDVENDTLVSILNNPELKKDYNSIRSGVRTCSVDCSYFDFCGGGSPSNKFHENGTFNSTETAECRFGKKAWVDALVLVFENQNR